MARFFLAVTAGGVCGLGVAAALSYALLMWAPDLPEGIL
jgi:hypothetical protein